MLRPKSLGLATHLHRQIFLSSVSKNRIGLQGVVDRLDAPIYDADPKIQPTDTSSRSTLDEWAPVPWYPKTKGEKIAAAKKYNLQPEDYETYEGDDTRIFATDYPKLRPLNPIHKDPFYPYDNIRHKRNFGEPIEEWYKFNQEHNYDPDHEYDVFFCSIAWYSFWTYFLIALYYNDIYPAPIKSAVNWITDAPVGNTLPRSDPRGVAYCTIQNPRPQESLPYNCEATMMHTARFNDHIWDPENYPRHAFPKMPFIAFDRYRIAPMKDDSDYVEDHGHHH